MSGLRAEPAGANLTTHWRLEMPDYVTALGWAPNGRVLAAGAADGSLWLLDSERGEPRHRLTGHEGSCLCLAWSRDGRVLASGGEDGRIRFWESASGSPVAVVEGGGSWVEGLAASPRTALLASRAGRQLRFWDWQGQLLGNGRPCAHTLADLAWQAEGGYLVTAGYNQVALWRPDRPEPVRTLERKGSLLKLALRPNGRHIVVGCQDTALHLWDTRRYQSLYMSGYATKVRELSWSGNSRWLASGGGSTVVVWDFSGSGPAGSEPILLELHQLPVTALAYQTWGTILASGGQDGLVCVADSRQRQVLAGAAYREPVSALVWQPGDRALAVGYGSGRLALYGLPGTGG